MDIGWITTEEASIKWGIKIRQVQALCSKGKVPNAVRKGHIWLIPNNSVKPLDGRTKRARDQKYVDKISR